MKEEIEERGLYDYASPKAKYTSFSNEHGTLYRLKCMLQEKAYLHKVKSIEIIPNIFRDHKALKTNDDHA